jgi:hypothetical protein
LDSVRPPAEQVSAGAACEAPARTAMPRSGRPPLISTSSCEVAQLSSPSPAADGAHAER